MAGRGLSFLPPPVDRPGGAQKRPRLFPCRDDRGLACLLPPVAASGAGKGPGQAFPAEGRQSLTDSRLPIMTNPLYHFTSAVHVPTILASGYLKTVESNVSFKREHAGPDVVWLTTSPTAEAGHGLQSSLVDKTEIRFTVEVDKRSVHKWREWAKARGSSQETMTNLARSGGSASWRVVTTPIPAANWVEVRNMATGEILLDRETIQGIILTQRSGLNPVRPPLDGKQ
jgi:hypothetical protein